VSKVKYSDLFMDWLKDAGYTHCFFVSGGNVMHLLESASSRFHCIPFVHEVGATIAGEYFNEICDRTQRAFVLVTAGPGLTNTITGLAGAWTESRELLVVGGQARVQNLSRGQFRQIGHQEIDGRTLVESITKASFRVEEFVPKKKIFELIELSQAPRKGPVFIEFCLDISTTEFEKTDEVISFEPDNRLKASLAELEEVANAINSAERPVVMIGGGISRDTDLSRFKSLEIPLGTTFNGSDRVSKEYPYYISRPDWYGPRWSNIILQQADYVLAIGTKLGLMQVGHNWKEYAPLAKIHQIEIDQSELEKGFPIINLGIVAEANAFVDDLAPRLTARSIAPEWKSLIRTIRQDLAQPEKINKASSNYLEAMKFVFDLIEISREDDVIIPCSSGAAAYEGAMRVILNKQKQLMVTNNAMGSMGYGLSGSIGASLSYPNRRTILFEGDGGFAQNFQELGTVKANNLNLKIFIMDNQGYQSIRGNQKSAFNSHYVGCDRDTGLFLPDWKIVAEAFQLEVMELNSETFPSSKFTELFESKDPVVFVVKIDPDQTYWPRILSRKNEDGSMVSNPLHKMEPPLSQEQEEKYLVYIK
jgi:acetolactate synthase I/II/III large subunit